MKRLNVGIVLALVMFAGSARADDGSEAWITKCVNEVDPEDNAPHVVRRWCSCMNYKMSANETLSILEWQNKPEGAKANIECNKESGWIE